MGTKEYEKAEQELARLMNLNKNLSEVNTKILEGKEVLEELTKHIEATITMNIPILRTYLKDLIEIRMTFGREVVDLLRSSNEMKDLTKSTKSIMDLAGAIITLKEVMTPETVTLMQNLFGSDKKEEKNV